MAKAPKNPKENAQDSASAPKIRVIAKIDGFRRAGITHSGDKTYEPGELTDQQIALLKDEPNLVVDEIAVEIVASTPPDGTGNQDDDQKTGQENGKGGEPNTGKENDKDSGKGNNKDSGPNTKVDNP